MVLVNNVVWLDAISSLSAARYNLAVCVHNRLQAYTYITLSNSCQWAAPTHCLQQSASESS